MLIFNIDQCWHKCPTAFQEPENVIMKSMKAQQRYAQVTYHLCVMHQSGPHAHPPGQPPGISLFFFWKAMANFRGPRPTQKTTLVKINHHYYFVCPLCLSHVLLYGPVQSASRHYSNKWKRSRFVHYFLRFINKHFLHNRSPNRAPNRETGFFFFNRFRREGIA